jgi:hypothetical protein
MSCVLSDVSIIEKRITFRRRVSSMAPLRKSPLVAASVGFALGVAFGGVVFARKASDGTPPTDPTLRAASPVSQGTESAEAPWRGKANAPVGAQVGRPLNGSEAPHAVAPRPDALTPDASLDPRALVARVHALEQELALAKDHLVEVGGKPLQEPPDLPDRFKQQVLLDAVRGAFREVNPKAEVTSIDCTEYPCIAYGSGLTMDQLHALGKTSALQVYRDDDVSQLVINGTVAVLATPKNDPNVGDDAQQRILMRLHQMSVANKTR